MEKANLELLEMLLERFNCWYKHTEHNLNDYTDNYQMAIQDTLYLIYEAKYGRLE